MLFSWSLLKSSSLFILVVAIFDSPFWIWRWQNWADQLWFLDWASLHYV